ncbi:putative ribonuclease H-like domain-containing protein [Tanacetum coccineum]
MTHWPPYLLRQGFQRGQIDQTLFIKSQKEHILLVQIYVDDIIFGFTKKELCDEFEKLMKDKFQMSSMGELTFYLGLQAMQEKTIVATSTTEAEYVAAASCCGQILWIQNQLLDYGYNFMNTIKSLINATIDGHTLSITEGSLRRHLKLADQDGITSIPLQMIFSNWCIWAIMTGYAYLCKRHHLHNTQEIYPVSISSMKVFSNMKRSTKGFSGQEVALFPNMLDVTEPSPLPSPSRITSSPSSTPLSSPEPTPAHTPSPTQPNNLLNAHYATFTHTTSPNINLEIEHHLPTPHDSPLHAVYSHGSDEGSLKLQELMNLITTLSDRIRQRDKLRVVLSDNEVLVKKILPNSGGSSLMKCFKKKASTDTEIFIQEVTPTFRYWSKVNLSTAGGTVTYTRRSAEKRSRQDKGKAIMIEEEPKKKSKKDLEQERLSYAKAINFEEQLKKEQRAQIARDEEIASSGIKKERKRSLLH